MPQAQDATKPTLEDFALKGNHLAKMTGVNVGTHAIPDAFILMHTGVGCKYKTGAQLSASDWAEHPNRREAWTQVGEVQLIQGSGARIGPFARTHWERRRSNFVVVVSAYFIELTGEDFRDVVKQTETTIPADMAMIGTAAPNGGFYEGYAEVIQEVVKKIDWGVKPTNKREAAILGHWFSRYEGDTKGDLMALKGLLRAVALKSGPVLLSGTPYPDLLKANASEFVLVMPYMGKKARRLKRLTKRELIPVDLPISTAGTDAFLRTVGAATGFPSDRLEAWMDAQKAAVAKQLDILRDHVRHQALAVFADGPLAAGLVATLVELGIRTPVVGIRETWLGGKAGFLETLDRWGVQLWPDTEVIENPSLRLTLNKVNALRAEGRIQGIMASSHEITLFSRREQGQMGGRRFAYLEVGFPTDHYHVALPTPTMGYTGTLTIAQRLLDAFAGYA